MKRIIWFFFLTIVPGIQGQIDMNGKAFSFYKRRVDHVRLIPATKHFTAFTLCLKSCKSLTEQTLVVAVPNSEDSAARFLVTASQDKLYIKYKNQYKQFSFADSKTWVDICVTFNFRTGKFVLLLDGKEHEILLLGGSKQSAFHAQDIIIGQKKVKLRTDVAEITNVNIWSSALTARDLQRFMKQSRGGDIIGWRSLVFKSDHAVTIEQPRCSTKDKLSNIFPPK
ncbi:uncharacterized protein LOC120982249 [Bufo bufo]|uniref:uncharacterized protein LOC120982249 n=1 Tax=Bufo bufo TaxID=8384 RepID=UPI001ABE124B|nr:uncharacterized protein LOC120982249 [Bufo bufo]